MAIKKIPGAFDDLVDAKRIVREIRLLRHFNHENVMKVVDILPPSSLEDFDVREKHLIFGCSVCIPTAVRHNRHRLGLAQRQRHRHTLAKGPRSSWEIYLVLMLLPAIMWRR